jgi:hypothetical protein
VLIIISPTGVFEHRRPVRAHAFWKISAGVRPSWTDYD